MPPPGGVPEWPKGTGCKPVGSAYGGSNPPAPTPVKDPNVFCEDTVADNNTAEMQHVICQEIGHTFGLNHQSTDGTSLNTCRYEEHPPEPARLRRAGHDLHTPRLDDDDRRGVDLVALRSPRPGRRVEVRRPVGERHHADHLRPLGIADPLELLGADSACPGAPLDRAPAPRRHLEPAL
jgi:hypothetical protein